MPARLIIIDKIVSRRNNGWPPRLSMHLSLSSVVTASKTNFRTYDTAKMMKAEED